MTRNAYPNKHNKTHRLRKAVVAATLGLVGVGAAAAGGVAIHNKVSADNAAEAQANQEKMAPVLSQSLDAIDKQVLDIYNKNPKGSIQKIPRGKDVEYTGTVYGQSVVDSYTVDVVMGADTHGDGDRALQRYGFLSMHTKSTPGIESSASIQIIAPGGRDYRQEYMDEGTIPDGWSAIATGTSETDTDITTMNVGTIGRDYYTANNGLDEPSITSTANFFDPNDQSGYVTSTLGLISAAFAAEKASGN